MKDKQFWLANLVITLIFLVYLIIGQPYLFADRIVMLVAMFAMGSTLTYNVRFAKQGGEFYLRPIPGSKKP